ncbi:monosaccharide ABC transporter membrane protein, CUT2 family [Pseudonocardia thermophila]|uniref:Monosaccharide ABC transporter membrane protein, CUT2 family n=1 Tax=Pseudonocardia thermophila TaxID=1848 RepID=A0A1M6PMV1_PSETH|nr:ABC transporter permease [Pseudonocardia thermophila]SHK09220.1 monosaccharide ABC transporter membrane protein, CUT2 family [Pseudonocardia thermophila]
MIATPTTESPPRVLTRVRGVLKPSMLGQLAALPAIVIAVLVGSQLNRAFLTVDNIMTNVLAASAVLGVLTVAAALIIIAGHFDMSTQSVVAFAPVLSVWLVMPAAAGGSGVELDPVLGLLLIFVLGAVVGAINGFLVAGLKLNAFIVTLAMLILLQGMTLGIGGGETLSNLPEVFTYLGSARWLGIPAEVVVAVAVFVAAGLFMRYTVTGRQIYAIGGNPDAARASGIRVERITFWLFVASGVLAALAGLLMTARIASVTASQGNNILFTVFAAAVIGGIDLRGGRGRIVGVATGVLLLALVQNILLVSQIPSFWVNAIYGAIILLALMTGALAQGSWLTRFRRSPHAPQPAPDRSGDDR